MIVGIRIGVVARAASASNRRPMLPIGPHRGLQSGLAPVRDKGLTGRAHASSAHCSLRTGRHVRAIVNPPNCCCRLPASQPRVSAAPVPEQEVRGRLLVARVRACCSRSGTRCRNQHSLWRQTMICRARCGASARRVNGKRANRSSSRCRTGRRAQRLCLRRPGRDRHGLRCAIRETGGVLSQGCLAGIPALLLLTTLLWLFGQGLQTFFPQLLKLKVLIYVPQ